MTREAWRISSRERFDSKCRTRRRLCAHSSSGVSICTFLLVEQVIWVVKCHAPVCKPVMRLRSSLSPNVVFTLFWVDLRHTCRHVKWRTKRTTGNATSPRVVEHRRIHKHSHTRTVLCRGRALTHCWKGKLDHVCPETPAHIYCVFAHTHRHTNANTNRNTRTNTHTTRMSIPHHAGRKCQEHHTSAKIVRRCSHLWHNLIVLGQVCSARAAAIDAVSKEVDLEHFPHVRPYFSTFDTLLPQLTDSWFRILLAPGALEIGSSRFPHGRPSQSSLVKFSPWFAKKKISFFFQNRIPGKFINLLKSFKQTFFSPRFTVLLLQ